MRCPKCHVKISEISNYCSFCGFDLNIQPTPKPFKIRKLIGMACICMAVYFAFQYIQRIPLEDPLQSELETFLPVSETNQKIPAKISKKQTSIQRPDFSLGLVTIYDIAGRKLTQTPVPIVSRGWVALPKNICLGGYRWVFSDTQDLQIDIEWGILHDQDEAGLWWVEGSQEILHPELSSWRPEAPLYWSPLLIDEPPLPVTVGKTAEQGNFIKLDLDEKYAKPGVFFQQGLIVGWSFGKEKKGCFLWNGIQGKDLSYDFRVQDFYQKTFSGSREEAFATALGEKYFSDTELLAALAKAYLLESTLQENDIPSYLRHNAIIKKIRSLVTGLIADTNYLAVASDFDAEMLIQAQDTLLLSHVVYAVLKNEGDESAIRLMEAVRPYISLDEDPEKNKLNTLHLKLYQGWLSTLIEGRNLYKAGITLDTAFNFFPEDPSLHLWRVQLALAYNDWEEAQRLLYSRNYPIPMQDKANNLMRQISDLKSRQGKIVIHFSPGSNVIPVFADLNESTQQKFIIDTGASMTTIPSSIAKKLGIKINDKHSFRTLYTAGGVIRAPEISLSSIRIENWIIRDIKVLVVDLPQQQETGLLGLNYLNRFKINLNSDLGILTLEPR